MKLVQTSCGIIMVLMLLLKLFTYEFSLRDDPTVGVALRATPSFVSRSVLQHSPSAHAVLIQDENDFPAGGIYRALVSWGWIAVFIAGLCVFLVPRRRPQ